MPIQYACKACGVVVTEATINKGAAVRQGRTVYCSECSALILVPTAAKASWVMPSISETPTLVGLPVALAKPAPKTSRLSGRRGASERSKLVEGLDLSDPAEYDHGIEVLDEFQIISAGSSDPVLNVAPDQGVEDEEEKEDAVPKGRVSSLRRRRRVRTGRHALARNGKPAATGRDKPVAKSSSSTVRALKPSVRRSASKSSRSPIPQPPINEAMADAPSKHKEVFFRSAGSPRAAPMDLGKHAETTDLNVLQPGRDLIGKNSKSLGSSLRIKPASRETTVSSRQSQKKRLSTSSQGAGGVTGNHLVVSLVALVVLIFVTVLIVSSGEGNPTSKKNVITNEDNKLPAYYLERAEALLAQKKKLDAADYYQKAADAFEREGNSAMALKYNQAAYGLRFKTAY